MFLSVTKFRAEYFYFIIFHLLLFVKGPEGDFSLFVWVFW